MAKVKKSEIKRGGKTRNDEIPQSWATRALFDGAESC